MNASFVTDVLLIGAAVVWILARQVQVGRVKPRLLWLVPLLLVPGTTDLALHPAVTGGPELTNTTPIPARGMRSSCLSSS
jgi:hypothetical protein